MAVIVGALGYSLEHASRLENESRQDDATQIGARSQLRDDVRENCMHSSQPNNSFYRRHREAARELACERF